MARKLSIMAPMRRLSFASLALEQMLHDVLARAEAFEPDAACEALARFA